MSPRARLIGSGLALVLLTTATSCSSEDDAFTEQSADQIVEAAVAAMGDLEAMHLEGTLDSGGTPIDLDLTISRSGDCTGTLGLEAGTAELLGVGGEVWFRPDREFWLITAGTEDLADQLLAVSGDRWVTLPETNTTYPELCDLDSFLDGLFDQEDATYTRGEVIDIADDRAIGIASERTDRPATTGFVSVSGPHVLLRIAIEGEAPSQVDFSDFDDEPEVEAPAEEDQIGLEELQGSVL